MTLGLDHFFCNRALGAAYLRIPKCGCSSFESWIAAHHPGFKRSPGLAVHSPEANRTYFDAVTRMPDRDRFPLRFTFVREPVRRFLSFYRDKLLRSRGNEEFLARTRPLGFRSGMSMTDALELIAAMPVDQMNPHFAPQTLFLFDGPTLRVDFIGRFERLGEDIGRLQRLLDSPLAFPHRNPAHGGEAPLLSPREQQLLAQIYEQDFKLLGYRPPQC